MLYLWIFGDNVEDMLGPVRFLFFYLACGVVASLAQIALIPDLPRPPSARAAPSPGSSAPTW